MQKVKDFSEKKIAEIATILQMPLADLEHESLRVYLEHRLADVESGLNVFKQRYKVNSSREMEQLYRDGSLTEKDSWEDFFRFDHLEAERDSLRRALDAL